MVAERVYVEVSGKTYDVKEKLKSLGLRWDGDRKVWKGTIDEGYLNKLEKLAEKNSLELSKRSLWTPPAYDNEVDQEALQKVYEIAGEKISAFVFYASPRFYRRNSKVVSSADAGKVRVVAKVVGDKGTVMLAEDTYKKTAKELLRKAKKVYESVEDYDREMFYRFKEDRWDGRNRGYVRCWECGRLVPPGEAEWDGNGWYCGC